MKKVDDEIWEDMKGQPEIHGRKILWYEKTDSTNLLAMEMIRKQTAVAGTVIIAEQQTAGRGRLGKKWLSPPQDGLYFSIILQPRLNAAELPKVTLAAGLGACLGLEKRIAVYPKMKWPNDLLLNKKKIGGILAETDNLLPADRNFIIIGVGVNISTPLSVFPADLQHKASSIKEETGKSVLRGTLLMDMVEEICRTVETLEQGEFSQILTEWRKRDGLRGQKLYWVTQNKRHVEGVSLGPDKDGILQIRDDVGNIHSVLSGDLDWIP